jgi:riboflavin kinase, archaea type
LQTIKFVGTVYSGKGCGRFFVEMPWVMRQLKEITGFTPFLGTLNLRLVSESTKQRGLLTPQNGAVVKPENGYLPGYLYKAKIFDMDCYVVVPDVPDYPKDLLEVIAAENLRTRFNVKDGDTIAVTVSI